MVFDWEPMLTVTPEPSPMCRTDVERRWFCAEMYRRLGLHQIVLDPTAGGGSIPFESARLGLNTFGNDLNPVAALIERATIEMPLKHGLQCALSAFASEYIGETSKKRLAFAVS
jgi:adenine-specific DNA methylase